MADHQFKLGQTVSLRRPTLDRSTPRSVEVIRLLPASADGERHYRVRGSDKVERAVSESELVRADGPS